MPLSVIIRGSEWFDNKENIFRHSKDKHFVLEHSLISISKWESIWKEQFIGNENLTTEQLISYFKCMVINPHGDEDAFDSIDTETAEEIVNYMNDSHTATKVKEVKSSGSGGDPPTSDFIYYTMFTYRIPKECERWHINRLLNLIKIYAFYNQPKKKKSMSELRSEYARINAMRRGKKH